MKAIIDLPCSLSIMKGRGKTNPKAERDESKNITPLVVNKGKQKLKLYGVNNPSNTDFGRNDTKNGGCDGSDSPTTHLRLRSIESHPSLSSHRR